MAFCRSRGQCRSLIADWFAPPLLSIFDALIDTLTSVILALAAIRVMGILSLAVVASMGAALVVLRLRRGKGG